MNQPTQRPEDAKSLSDCLADGSLSALDRSRIRASLSFVSADNPADMRNAIMHVLARVEAYMRVIEYTGPGYVFGRADSDYPHAQGKTFVHGLGLGWYRPSIKADGQADLDELFSLASGMCLDTACRVAAHELSKVVPESREALRIAARVVSGSVVRRELSGVFWSDSKRRLKSKGLGKLLRHLAGAIATARVGIVDQCRVVIACANEPDHLWPHVRHWHNSPAAQ
jgi:hypothetical protein